MVKSKGGKKKRKGKKGDGEIEKRQLEFKEEGQEYARITKMLGEGRVEAQCSDGELRICHIRGTMRKRVWVSVDDLILVDIRSYQDGKADVVYKYTPDEDRTLQSYGELVEGTSKKDELEAEEDNVIISSDDDSEHNSEHDSVNNPDSDHESDNNSNSESDEIVRKKIQRKKETKHEFNSKDDTTDKDINTLLQEL